MVRKRGRPPKREEVRKAAHINTRIPEDLRARLDAAAEANNHRTLSEEIARRLESSFQLAFQPDDTPMTKRLCAMIVHAIGYLEAQTECFWHSNPFTHMEVADAVRIIVANFAPDGEVAVPPGFPAIAGFSRAFREQMRNDLLKEGVGRHAAAAAIEADKMAQEERELARTGSTGDSAPWRPSLTERRSQPENSRKPRRKAK